MTNSEGILDENGCFLASSVEKGFRTLASRKQATPILDLRGIPLSKIPNEIGIALLLLIMSD